MGERKGSKDFTKVAFGIFTYEKILEKIAIFRGLHVERSRVSVVGNKFFEVVNICF